MKNVVNQTVIILLAVTLILTSCGFPSAKEEESPYEDFIVVDVFDSLANYQGIQSGWFAKIVKDKFNMELNIIAPNVAGGGDTLFEIRSAAGNLGDLIICSSENGIIQDMVTAGLLTDMEPYLKDKQIMRFEAAIGKMNENITPSGIYAIPSELSENAPTIPGETLELNYGPYVRWDLYKELGYPEIHTLEDLLPVLKQMQELEPVAENGEKTYGFSFFRDWDANLMNAAKQPCCFYGYDEYGFALVKADGSDYQSIADSDSLYIRVLKWYFDANQMGLVDPESPTQNYDSFVKKHEEGQVLYSPWPWVAQLYYNTISRKNEGKGFMLADIKDMQIYSYGCSPDGNQKIAMAIGSQAQDPERLADFVDWLYSPEGISIIGAQTSSGTAGPEGLCWVYGENGPKLTEFGKKALLENGAEIPEEWGGGSWEDGVSALNYKPVSPCELDDRGYPYAYLLWDSVIELNKTSLDADWREKMQADSTIEYLQENEKILVAPGCGYMALAETSEQTAIRTQCKAAVQKYSWNMIFAENEEEFYQLLEQMQREIKSLGYDTILELDMANAKQKDQARRNAVEEYESRQKEQK